MRNVVIIYKKICPILFLVHLVVTGFGILCVQNTLYLELCCEEAMLKHCTDNQMQGSTSRCIELALIMVAWKQVEDILRLWLKYYTSIWGKPWVVAF